MYPLRGYYYRMGTSIASPQARQALERWGCFALCGERPEALPLDSANFWKSSIKTLKLVRVDCVVRNSGAPDPFFHSLIIKKRTPHCLVSNAEFLG